LIEFEAMIVHDYGKIIIEICGFEVGEEVFQNITELHGRIIQLEIDFYPMKFFDFLKIHLEICGLQTGDEPELRNMIEQLGQLILLEIAEFLRIG
jgi:hypothetical protein